MKLSGKDVAIDLTDYPVPPVEKVLGILVSLVQENFQSFSPLEPV
jgi:hypothetical protein